MEHPTLPEDWQAAVRQQIEDYLRDYFNTKQAQYTQLCPPGLLLFDAVQDLTLRGGKRLRPLLLYATAMAIEPTTDPSRLIKAGAALELLQSYFLVHDDWMDQDDLRRGSHSVHKTYETQGHTPHDAASLAILAGDLANTLAWDAMLEACEDHPQASKVLAVFSSMQQKVILGQCLDLLRYDDIESIYALKTGAYTSEGPVQLAAALCGANAGVQKKLSEFAVPLGLAFQLKDDVLGCFGQPKQTGKTVGSDLIHQKHTLVVELARTELGSEHFADRDESLPEKRDVERLIQRLEALNIPARIQTKIDTLLEHSLTALKQAPLSEQGKASLQKLAELFIERLS